MLAVHGGLPQCFQSGLADPPRPPDVDGKGEDEGGEHEQLAVAALECHQGHAQQHQAPKRPEDEEVVPADGSRAGGQ